MTEFMRNTAMKSENKTSAEKIMILFGESIMFTAGILMFAPLATLGAAIAGWMVGLFFGNLILDVLAQLGVRGVTMWQLGATAGFLGSFLRTKVRAEVKNP